MYSDLLGPPHDDEQCVNENGCPLSLRAIQPSWRRKITERFPPSPGERTCLYLKRRRERSKWWFSGIGFRCGLLRECIELLAQVSFGSLIFQAEMEQSFGMFVLPHHDQQASEIGNPAQHGKRLPSNMFCQM